MGIPRPIQIVVSWKWETLEWSVGPTFFLCEAEIWKTTMGMIYTYIYIFRYIHTNNIQMMDVYLQRGPYVSKYFILHVHDRYVGLVHIFRNIFPHQKNRIFFHHVLGHHQHHRTQLLRRKWRVGTNEGLNPPFGFFGCLGLWGPYIWNRGLQIAKRTYHWLMGFVTLVLYLIFYLSHNYRELCQGWFQDVL